MSTSFSRKYKLHKMRSSQLIYWLCKKCKMVILGGMVYISVFFVIAAYQELSIYHVIRNTENMAYRVNLSLATIAPPVTKPARKHEIITVERKTLVGRKPDMQYKASLQQQSGKKSDHRVTFLPYSKYFHQYPLDIDISNLVKASIQNHSKITVSPINPHVFQYIHNPGDCKFKMSNNDSKLVLLVKSSVNNFSLREAIRSTWGDNNKGFVTVFLLGATSPENQLKVENESKSYSDIVQEEFIDSYMNNTHKTIMGFNWAAKHCSSADFFFFVDDDHYVLVKNIVSYIKTIPSEKRENMFEGYLLANSVPYRDQKSKWYISRDSYPFNKYPPYLAGGAFLASRSTVNKFSLAFPFVKYIGIDDSYLGIVAKKLKIVPKHNRNFHHRSNNILLSGKERLFASHGFKKPDDMLRVFQNLIQT